MSVKLILIRKSGNKTVKNDITEMTTDINWSGDGDSIVRKLDFDMSIVQELGQKPQINVPVGSMIVFYNNSKEKFRGFVFNVSTGADGKQSVNCYDSLVYVSKNTHSILVKNKTASEVIIELCKKFNIPMGNVPNTVYKIKRKVFQNVSLADIFKDLLIETRRNTNKSYKIVSEKGKLNLVKRDSTKITTLVINDILSGSRDTSIENLVTQVLVTKGSLDNDKDAKKYKTYQLRDSIASQYGILQKVEDADEKDSYDKMKKLAESVLSQNNKPETTLDIDYIGVDTCITGTKVKVKNDTLGINKTYYVSSDSHSWSNGSYNMSLQLSERLV